MEEAVTESIIRQANQSLIGQGETIPEEGEHQQSIEKENIDQSNGIINVETFVAS